MKEAGLQLILRCYIKIRDKMKNQKLMKGEK